MTRNSQKQPTLKTHERAMNRAVERFIRYVKFMEGQETLQRIAAKDVIQAMTQYQIAYASQLPQHDQVEFAQGLFDNHSHPKLHRDNCEALAQTAQIVHAAEIARWDALMSQWASASTDEEKRDIAAKIVAALIEDNERIARTCANSPDVIAFAKRMIRRILPDESLEKFT